MVNISQQSVNRELESHILEKILGTSNYDELSIDCRRELLMGIVSEYFNNFHNMLPQYHGENFAFASAYRALGKYESTFKDWISMKRASKKIINDLGLNKSRIKSYCSIHNQHRSTRNHFEFMAYVHPIYVALRMQGHSHEFLTR